MTNDDMQEGMREGWYALFLSIRLNLTPAQAVRAISGHSPTPRYLTREELTALYDEQERLRKERMRRRRKTPRALAYQREYQRRYRKRLAQRRVDARGVEGTSGQEALVPE